MNVQIIVAIIGLVGSGVGALGGVLISARLTAYRLEQLEKKVDKHNNLIERMYRVEETVAVQGEKLKAAGHRIDDLESRIE